MEQRTIKEATKEQITQEQTSMEQTTQEHPNKLQMLWNIGDQPNMKIDDDPEVDREVKAQLEEALKNLTLEDLKNYEKTLPFQGEIEELLKDLVREATSDDVYAELQVTITDLAAKAKQRQICKKNAAKVKEYDAIIEELLTKIVSMIKAIREDAQGACSILTQRYVSKLTKDYNLDQAIADEIQQKLYVGLGCFVGGAAIIAAGAGIAWSATNVAAAGALGVAGPFALPVAAAVSVVVFGIGVWKLLQSREMKKAHPKLVEFYDEMNKVNDKNAEITKLDSN